MHIYMLNKVHVKLVYPFNVFQMGNGFKECDEISTDFDIPSDVMICRPGAVIFDISKISDVATIRLCLWLTPAKSIMRQKKTTKC